MDIEPFFEEMPFADLLGIEVTEASDGHAEGRLDLREELSWHRDRLLAHGGVTFTLADTVGGAALVSLVDRPVPTVDMRVDYLDPGTGTLRAEADVVRLGGDVGVVDVEVTSGAGVESAGGEAGVESAGGEAGVESAGGEAGVESEAASEVERVAESGAESEAESEVENETREENVVALVRGVYKTD